MESVFSMHEALVDPQHEENWEEVRSRSGGTWLLPTHCKDAGIAPLMLGSDKILSLSLWYNVI